MSTDKRIYNSLQDFKTLLEFPDTKPLAVIGQEGMLVYCNRPFTTVFQLAEKSNIDILEIEPPLMRVVQGLAESRYSSFSLDATINIPGMDEASGFTIELERVFIEAEEFTLLRFTSNIERKRMEEKINNLGYALDYGDVPALIADSKTLVTYATRSFEKILGKTIEEIYRHPLQEVLETICTPLDIPGLEIAITEGKEWIKVISHEGDGDNISFVEVRLNPVKQSEKQTFIVTANDISDYVIRNRMIQRSEERLRSIIANISDLLLVLRKENGGLIIETVNDRFALEFSFRKQDISGKYLEAIAPPDLTDAIISNAQLAEQSVSRACRFQFSDVINEREFLCKLSVMNDQFYHSTLLIVTLSDVTEQMQYEEQLKKAYEKEQQLNKLKAAFLANMSHEIRTPSTAIVGYATLLYDDVMSGCYDSVQEFAGYLKDGITRMLNLVDNIVEVSMLESGSSHFDMVEQEIHELLREAYRKVEPLAVKTGITFGFDFDDENILAHTDAQKFRKITEAIMDNAIKYNKAHGKVVVKTISFPDSYSIHISDSGRGIDEQKLEAILEPFVQEEDEGHKRRYEGAGLGLTIAYRLTQALGGEFKVRSKKNEGTSIILKFPKVLPR